MGENKAFEKVAKVGNRIINHAFDPIKGLENKLVALKKGIDQAKEREYQETIERLAVILERVSKELDDYNDDQKARSQLTVAVKVLFTDMETWATLINSGKPPQDLIQTIKRRIEDLDSSVQGEQLRFGRDIDNKLDVSNFFTKLGTKKPMEYYTDGKALLQQKKWVDAKTNFLRYQSYADAKRRNKLPKELENLEIKDPYEDQHLEYLEFAQKKLNEEMNTPDDPEMIGLMSKTVYPNPYTAAKVEWRKAFPKGGGPQVSSPPSSSSSSSNSSDFQGTK